MNSLNKFINQIPPNGILSLDIFDTAITRAVAVPTHLFAVMQGRLLDKYGKRFNGGLFRNFIEERLLAEKNSRLNGGTVRAETSLDLIYKKLAETNKNMLPFVEEIKALEVETELAEARTIPEIKTVFDAALARGIKIVFTSDMYLPLNVIEKMLKKCGYSGYEKIYLSSSLQKTKSQGELWDLIAEDVEAKRKVFHIGDNVWSDVRQARERGVTAFHFKKYSEGQKNYAGFDEAIVPLSRLIAKNKLRETSSNADLPEQNDNPSLAIETIGRTHIALLYGSFIKWIDEQARLHGAKTIYFFSRDGWILKRVWESCLKRGLVSKEIRIEYAEVSRKVLFNAAITKVTDEVIDFILSGGEPNRPIRMYLERIGIQITEEVEEQVKKFFPTLEAPIPYIAWENVPARGLLRTLEKEILAAAEKLRARSLGYLREKGFCDISEPKMIVDLGWNGNMQKALLALLNIEEKYPKENIIGLYAGLFRGAQRNTHRSGFMQGMFCTEFGSNEKERRLGTGVQFLELVHAAPHGSVTDYKISDVRGNYEAVFVENKSEMELYSSRIGPMQEAAIKALEEGLADGTIVWDALTPDIYRAVFSDIVLFPSKIEVQELALFSHVDGFDHTGESVTLVPEEIPTDLDSANSLLWRRWGAWISGIIISWITKKTLSKEILLTLLETHGHLGKEWKDYCKYLINKTFNNENNEQ
ncbi:MAG: hypothetical protein LBT53_02405 [Puniceicoccales bacterium]|jgi:predicted HAD superfamily hydrolase|nr:hypothetical protein [Puniceicoccales bacterium]